MELKEETFYACFVNGDHMQARYPMAFENDYQLIHAGVVDPFLKRDDSLYEESGEQSWFAGKKEFQRLYETFLTCGLREAPFIHDKLDFFGRQQICYLTVPFFSKREAGKLGAYGCWYRITLTQKGKYEGQLRDVSSLEGIEKRIAVSCDIEPLKKTENTVLQEIFHIYPDNQFIFEGKGDPARQDAEGAYDYFTGQQIQSVIVWNGADPYYLCTEFYNQNNEPVGLFDMSYHDSVFESYSDALLPGDPNSRTSYWPGREPITVYLSHLHEDHYKGLYYMLLAHREEHATFHYFFRHISLTYPCTIEVPDVMAIVAAIKEKKGLIIKWPDHMPFKAWLESFSVGHIQFNHPRTNAYDPHPHLHGLYARGMLTTGERYLVVGDTVYRGIDSDILEWNYDVLVACHHGGDFNVASAGVYYPPGKTAQDYVPTPGGTGNRLVIYSANGNGHTHAHPFAEWMIKHRNMGWTNERITNENHVAF